MIVHEPGDRELPDFEHVPFHCWNTPDGTLWASFHRRSRGYLLRFPGLAQFTIDEGGARIEAWPSEAAGPDLLEHLYLNQVLPLALSQQGRLVLHASCVSLGNRAIAFAGQSGAGKSTIAASFASAGFSFLCDDALALDTCADGWSATPSHPSVRLWQDSHNALLPTQAGTSTGQNRDGTPKARLYAGKEIPHCCEPRPLARIYVLAGEADGVEIARIRPAEAVIALVRNSFTLETQERAMLAAQFDAFSSLAQCPGMLWSLRYPRNYPALPLVRDTLLAHAGVPADA